MSEPRDTEPEQKTGRLGKFIFQRTPRLLAIFTFLAGASLLVSAVLPGGLPTEYPFELPPYISILGGFALMAMALGLAQRVRIAYLASALVLLLGAGASILYEPSPARAAGFAGLLVALIGARRAFFRKSDLSWLRPNRIWFLTAGLAVAMAAIFASLWAGRTDGLMGENWWALIGDPVIGRAGRPLAFAILLLAVLGFARLVASPRRPEMPHHLSDDLKAFSNILIRAEGARPEAMLAYSGDKSFLFSETGQSAIMYAASSNMLIAMGQPIGQPSEFGDLIARFSKLAGDQGMPAIFYATPPECLPDLLEQKFRVEKIGENAVLELEKFSLSGRKREALRRGRRKLAERRQATFELSLPPHKPELIAQLKPVSDAWIGAVGGKEKSFSLGRFDTDFLAYCPIGVVALDGKTVAFGTLSTVPSKGWAGIDLMRYDSEQAVTNTMDFLLVELILWCQREGYQKFDLSMAPLSGLDVPEEAGPLFARIGHLIFTHGERFYNFQGLRRFKQKFDPVWEPRYIAAPARWLLPVGLAQAARLTNNSAKAGDEAGIAKKWAATKPQ